MIGYLLRLNYSEIQTLGHLLVLDDVDKVFDCATLEPAWKNNENNISCIPPGQYKVVRRWSNTYQNHYHVQDVDGRTLILIHPGNFRRNTRGCILVGAQHTDIDGDGNRDVTASRVTMERMLDTLPDQWTLRVIR